MSTNRESPEIPSPRTWRQHVRPAVLHVISLAQYAAVYVGSWAAEVTFENVKQLLGFDDPANREEQTVRSACLGNSSLPVRV